jgi:uncharacterized protein
MQYKHHDKDLDIKIQHIGLKKDIHHFKFLIDDQFFVKFENSIIQKAEISIQLQLDKRIEPYLINLEIDGYVQSDCDKCNANFPLKIQSDNTVYVKFSGEQLESEEDTEIIFIGRDESEIDLNKIIYDILHLNLPIYKICNSPGKTTNCDLEVLKALDIHLNQEKEMNNDEIDPRWANLNKLKDKLN